MCSINYNNLQQLYVNQPLINSCSNPRKYTHADMDRQVLEVTMCSKNTCHALCAQKPLHAENTCQDRGQKQNHSVKQKRTFFAVCQLCPFHQCAIRSKRLPRHPFTAPSVCASYILYIKTPILHILSEETGEKPGI